MSAFTKKEIDLCNRTKANLDYIIEAKKRGCEVYETTQLFNSFLGIIINLHENEILNDEFKHINIKGIRVSWGIPDIRDNKLSEFLYHLRNAIAHMNVEFDSKGTFEIKRLHMENIDENGKKCWECNFPISGVRTFINKICEYVENN